MSIKLRRIELTNFKCFPRYSVTLTEGNVLLGPKNSGKSTIIDAVRCLGGALRFARTRKPQLVADHSGAPVMGFDIPDGSIPVSVTNIANEYSDASAVAKFTFENQESLTLQLHPERATRLVINAVASPRSRPAFQKLYPARIVIVPPLGPFEPTERFLDDDYVRAQESSRLSYRHFRNIWLRKSTGEFDEFAGLVHATWPEVEVKKPIHHPWPDNNVVMFFEERRMTREVHWSGVGLQIWLQILTHILRANAESIIVIDEPDIYLHPDLQKRLMEVIKQRSLQFIMATHSTEIINESQNEDLLVVNKQSNSAQRINDIEGFQRALAYIGSNENLELSRLSRAKRIVFFEGADRRLLKRFARRFGFRRFVEDTDTLFLRLGGFSFWHKVESASWVFDEILNTDIAIFRAV
jgi:predicted ATP-dependent endonuclease of OLD family